MVIGTARPEEAKVFDGRSGYHQFDPAAHYDEPREPREGETFGSFEVYWNEDVRTTTVWNMMPAGIGALACRTETLAGRSRRLIRHGAMPKILSSSPDERAYVNDQTTVQQ